MATISALQLLPDSSTPRRAAILAQTTHISDEQIRQRIWELLLKHQQRWLRPRSGKVTCWKAFQVHSKPVRHQLKHMPPELQKLTEEHLNSMLEKGVIRPSKSPWGARPVFVTKKDGTKRFCVDYRALNKQMVTDGYPLPLLWPMIQKAAGHEWYVSLDLN